MSCREEIRSWTFAALVGAFVDLAVAHLLLCAAAVVYFAERFLAFFGFELPCPYASVGDSSCIRGLLANEPVSRIASVRKSVWNAPPFDSVWAVDGYGGVGVANRGDMQGLIQASGGSKVELLEGGKRGREGSSGSVLLLRELKREAASDEPSSSTSVGGTARLHEVGSVSEEEVGARGGKRGSFASKPLRLGIRRRRREAERRKYSPNSDYGTPLLGWQESRRSVSPCSNTEISDRDFSNGNATPTPSRRNIPLVGANEEFCGSNSIRLADRSVSDAALNWTSSKCKGADTIAVDRSESKDAEIIRNLELALKEAQASCSALYRELEKERSAAASAADEAMGMIERLQQDKAAVEMNARQYQRMIEEKTTYDEEEMDILKEIVVRRERELYMLEKEVEIYREMMSGKNSEEALGVDNGIVGMSELVHPRSFELEDDDPTLMLRQLSRCIKQREKVNNNGVAKTIEQITTAKSTMTPCHVEQLSKRLFEESCSKIPQLGESSGADTQILPSNDGNCMDFHEKGIVSVDAHASSERVTTTSAKKLEIPEKSGFTENLISSVDEGRGNYDNTKVNFLSGNNAEAERNEREENDSGHNFSHLETESSTMDVHVVDDETVTFQGRVEKGNTSQTDTASVNSQEFNTSEPYGFKNAEISSDYSCTSGIGGEINIRRSSSDMARVRRSLDGSLSRAASPMGLRRNSTSAVETERSKLVYEIEDLRRRLKLVQQGREKLNFSVERVEKEKFQLQLLEEIALQLREIRQQTGLGSGSRQASLPPPSSKAISKKRRNRSASLGIQGSS